MIVVTGNWLISDGSLFPPLARGVIERFFGEIARLACLAGIGEDGSYRPVERIDVVLAGDTFDGLTSRRWTGRVRPWHPTTARQEIAEGLLWDAIRRGRGVLSRLGMLAKHGTRVPAADRRRRPVLGRFVPVQVGVTILPGDRDDVLERPLIAVASRYGFGVGRCWERIDAEDGLEETGVSIRHGHELDPLCGSDLDESASERQAIRFGRRPSVSESLAVDWLAAFASNLATTPCPPAFAGRIVRDVAAGPWTAATEILVRHLADDSLPADAAASVIDAWRRSIDQWHAAATADPPCFATGFDTVAALASWMQRVEVRRHGEPCETARGRCAEGWLDIRRQDLVASAARKGLSVLGHPPRGLSGGPVVALGPASDWESAGVAASAADDRGLDRRPVVEIDSAARPSAGAPYWIAIPRSVGTGGIVSSNEWTGAAA